MRYVAFLRGINVGGRVIKMTELTKIFENLGMKNVATVSQTGNVVFMSDMDRASLKQTIEDSLTRVFNYPAKILLIDFDELVKDIDGYPFPQTAEELHNYIVFFENGLEKSLLSEAKDIDRDLEKTKIGNRLIYWQVQKGHSTTTAFASYLTKTKYRSYNTVRNINTLNKIIKEK